MFVHLRDRTGVFERPTRLLHFAPEAALGAALSTAEGVEYISVDLEMPDVSLRMDICDLLFRDAVFDCVICSHVLEHVPDDRKAMSEIRRVLHPDGFAMILVPNVNPPSGFTYEDFSIDTPEGRERAFGQWDHVRMYGPDLVERLSASGLSVETVLPGSELPQSEVVRSGIDRNERLYICSPTEGLS